MLVAAGAGSDEGGVEGWPLTAGDAMAETAKGLKADACLRLSETRFAVFNELRRMESSTN